MSVNTLAVEAVSKALEVHVGKEGVAPSPLTPSTDDALAGLTKYIPTESLTLYVATVSSQKAITEVAPWLTPDFAYKAFIVITPVLMLVLFLRKLAVANQDWKISFKSWPWWKIIASTIAFAIWALAVPGNPIVDVDSAAGGVVAGFAALFVSTVLNVFAPFFEQK